MDYMNENVRPEGEPIVYARQTGRTAQYISNFEDFLAYFYDPARHEKETKALYGISPYSPYIRRLYADTMILKVIDLKARNVSLTFNEDF